MNYQKIYNNLTTNNRPLIKGAGYEIHHIIPRSVGGSDNVNNLVKLTYREHFVAHLILLRLYPGNKKLLYSVFKFTHSKLHHKQLKSSRTYKYIKEHYIESVTVRLNEQKLRQYFANENNHIYRAIEHFNCSYNTIKKNLEYYNIKVLWDGIFNQKFSKEEVIEMFEKYPYHTVSEVAQKFNLTYSHLNQYINEHSLNYLRVKNAKNQRDLLHYVRNNNKIKRHKLYKHFNMHPRLVTKILNENNIQYIDEDVENYNILANKLKVFFNNLLTPNLSKAGFSKSLGVSTGKFTRLINKLNIEYQFGTNHNQQEWKELHELRELIKRRIN